MDRFFIGCVALGAVIAAFAGGMWLQQGLHQEEVARAATVAYIRGLCGNRILCSGEITVTREGREKSYDIGYDAVYAPDSGPEVLPGSCTGVGEVGNETCEADVSDSFPDF